MYAVALATAPLTRAAPMVTLARFAESDQIVTGSAEDYIGFWAGEDCVVAVLPEGLVATGSAVKRVMARDGIEDIISAESTKQFRKSQCACKNISNISSDNSDEHKQAKAVQAPKQVTRLRRHRSSRIQAIRFF